MKFHFAGKYSGNPDDLPCLPHEPGAVPLREAANAEQLSRITTGLSIGIMIAGMVLSWIIARDFYVSYLGIFLFILTIVPHEFLHAICFKDDVYMYHDLAHGMLFVVGPERMSKARFIFKSLLPGIVLGFVPFIIFLFHPEWKFLGTMAALGVAAAAGDFYNANNALRQIPSGGRAYMHKYNTFWYMPKNSGAEGNKPAE